MRLPALLAGFALALAAPAAGQDTARGTPATPPAAPPAVPRTDAPAGRAILLGGDTVLTIYAADPPYTLEQRALAVTANIEHAVATATEDDRVVVRSSARGTYLVLRNEPLLHVLPADAAAAGTTPALLAERWALGLEGALARRLERVDERHIAQSLARALGATLVAVLLSWLLFRAEQRLEEVLRVRTEKRTRALDPRTSQIISPAQIVHAVVTVVRALRFAGLLAIAYGWLVAVLGAFVWSAPMADRVLRYVTTPLRGMLGNVVGYLPSLIFIVIVVAVLRIVLRALRLVFRAIETGGLRLNNFPAEWGDPTYKLVRALVVGFGLIVVFPYLPGAGSDAFNAISLFAGALFSLGSSGAVANIVAGSVITYTRAFRVGDFVRIGETEGMVVERSLLVTRVRTVANIDVSIPSATVLGTHVMNFSAMAQAGGLVVQSRVTIGYDAPWRTVHALLLAAADGTDGVLAQPAPFVVQESLSDYYPVYCLNVYTDRATGMDVFRLRSRLNENIQDRFFEAGVEILSPAYTSLRDGNRTAMPPQYLPKDYENPGFKVT